MNTLKLFTLFLSLCFFTSLFGQNYSCEDFEVSLGSQEEVNAWIGCEEIPSILTIAGPDITDLSPLSTLSSVQRLRIISNPLLTDLYGLHNITHVNEIWIDENANLTTLTNLGNFTELDFFYILSNPSLSNLDGLEQLSSINNTLVVENNPSLTNVNGLSNLENLTHKLTISRNSNLQDCCGLAPLFAQGSNYSNADINLADNCSSIFEILNSCTDLDCNLVNPILSSQAQIDAWQGCQSWEGTLTISGPDIVDLKPLQTLTNGGTLRIAQNPELFSLEGLENIHTLEQGFIIQDNLLQNLIGLQGLRNINDAFLNQISEPQLTSLAGLEFLSDLTRLQLTDNPQLTTLNALYRAGRQLKYLEINQNDALTDLKGLELLNNVETLIIRDNALLEDINTLSNLTRVSNELRLQQNTSLQDCCGIAPLLSNGTTSNVSINGNLNCNSAQAILTNCDASETFCTTEHIILSSQDQVNNWLGCTTVDKLEINGADINDLSPLMSLNQVNHLLIKDCPNLTNLDGLNNLQNVLGGVTIELINCAQLNDLSALAASSIDYLSTIKLDNLDALTTFDFSWHTNIGLDLLHITNNDNLVSGTGFPELTNVREEVLIENNPKLENLLFFSSLRSVGNPFNGFFISNHLSIQNNDALVDLRGLENLREVIESFTISGNDNLQNLDALSNLNRAPSFELSNHPNLQDCCGVYPLLSTGMLENLTFFNNGACESVEEIIENCNDNTCNEDIVLSSQEDVNNWIGCTELNASLRIQGDDVTDLSPLSTLKKITGSLIIRNSNSLISLNGLNNLSMANALIIDDNENISDLTALSQLTTLGSLRISNNKNLSALNGLENLTAAAVVNIVFNLNLSDCCAIYPLLSSGNSFDLIEIFNNQSPCDTHSQILGSCEDTPEGVDLELAVTPNFTTYEIYKDLKFSLELTNAGTANASGINVNVRSAISQIPPNYLVYTGHSYATPSIPSQYEVGGGNWRIPDLGAGETVVLELVLYTLVGGDLLPFSAQVTALNEQDVDSSPNNYAFYDIPDEDDEVFLIIYPADDSTPFADLELSMSADMLQAKTGDEVVYTLALRNNGPNTATGIIINHLDLMNQSYVSHSLSGGAYDPSTKIWNVGNIGSGNTVELHLRLHQDQLEDGEENILFFQVVEVDQNDNDSSPANAFSHNYGHEDDEIVYYLEYGDNEPISTTIDLELELTVDDPNYTIFDYVTYTLTVTNTGTQAAQDVVIDWKVPEGMKHHEAIVSSGNYYSWSGEWFIYEPIFGGESESIQFTVWTNVEGVEITSYAQVIEMQGTDTDSNIGNGQCCVPNEDDEAAVIIGTNFNFNNNVQSRSQREQLQKLIIHNVYPTPAVNQVNVTISTLTEEAFSYKIYDIQGNVVRQDQLANGKQYHEVAIDIRELPSGIYMMVFNTQTYHAPIRFLKQRM